MMARKDFTLLTLFTFGALLTKHTIVGGLIRPPAVPPFASTLSVYLSPPPPSPLLPGPPPLLPSPHFLPNLPPPPSPFNPLFFPSVLSGFPVLPNAPLLPPPLSVNGLRFFSTKGVFPLLPAYPPVLPAPAPAPLLPTPPVLPPAAFPPAAFPPGLLPAYPAGPAFPPPAFPAFPGLPTFLSAGPFASIKHLYRRDVNSPK